MTPPTAAIVEGTPAPDANSRWLRPVIVSPWWEIVAVLVLTQSHSIYAGARIFLRRSSGIAVDLRLTDYRAVHLLGVESAILALLLVYLHHRGWTRDDLRIRPTLATFGQGALLAIVNWIILIIAKRVILRSAPSLFFHSPSHLPLHVTHLGWGALAASQFINSLFEEVVCISYAFNQFAAKRGPLVGLLLMLLLRAVYHIWKSPAYLIITLIHFLVFGLWYWRTKNVWSLIVAHFTYDMLIVSPDIR